MMIDRELVAGFEEAGAAAGAAYRAFYDAFTKNSGGANVKAEAPAASRAFVIYYQYLMGYVAEDTETEKPATTDETPVVCGKCQCDTCGNLDACPVYPETEGIYPPPCEVCRDMAWPLVPKDGPECGRYTPKPNEDCRACWCRECGAFKDCVVDIEGYKPESNPCPCDGCKSGQRYMPKENPPCDNYILLNLAAPVPEQEEGSAEHDE